MVTRERRFALLVSGAHGANHFFKRLLPPLVPIWTVTFGFPLWKLGLLLGAISAGSAVSYIPVGIAADRYDRRYILPGGVAIMGISFVALALTSLAGTGWFELSIGGTAWTGTFLLMLVAMLVAGIGDSTFHPTGYPLITANVDPDRKGRVIGMWGGTAKFGDGAAPAVIGALLLVSPWPPILFGLGVVGLGYAAYLFWVLGEFETHPDEADTADSGGDDEDADGDTADSDGSGNSDDFDVWAADRRVYIYPMLAVFAFFAIRSTAAEGINVFIPEFITSVYGYSFSMFGLTVTPESTASFYFSVLLIAAGAVQLGTGALVDRYDHRKVLVSLLSLAALTLAVLALLDLPPITLFVVLIVLGASMWGFAPARDALISDITPEEREGRTFAYLWSVAKVIGAMSPVIIGYIGDTAGLRDAFLLIAVTTVLSAVPIALLLSDRFYVNIDDYRQRSGAD